MANPSPSVYCLFYILGALTLGFPTVNHDLKEHSALFEPGSFVAVLGIFTIRATTQTIVEKPGVLLAKLNFDELYNHSMCTQVFYIILVDVSKALKALP